MEKVNDSIVFLSTFSKDKDWGSLILEVKFDIPETKCYLISHKLMASRALIY